ncbi:hypothetical protein LQW54_006874 [Pestalotiopsis sp. IQ-011]
MSPPPTKPPPAHPYRQIRASYDDETITVYQAYSAAIASEAVARQRLDASPLFRPGRMTWIKPSWCWMMYRCGYSFKDAGQARVLALKMRRGDFLGLLERAVLTTEGATISTGAGAEVKVQWDPERSPRLDRLEYRSIQIGIRGSVAAEWVEKWIVGIEDVTERARALKVALDADANISEEELVAQGLVPEERPFDVSDTLREVLGMDRY